MSSEEIEDVVSSVRRLVSNEHRPRTLSRDLNADRLVLTPALRVVSEPAPLSTLILASPVADPAPDQADTADAVAAASPPDPAPEEILATPDTDATADLVEAEWEDDIWPEADPSLAEVALGAEEAELLSGEDAEIWLATGVDPSSTPPDPPIPLRRRAESLAARLAALPDGAVKAAAEPVRTEDQPSAAVADVVAEPASAPDVVPDAEPSAAPLAAEAAPDPTVEAATETAPDAAAAPAQSGEPAGDDDTSATDEPSALDPAAEPTAIDVLTEDLTDPPSEAAPAAAGIDTDLVDADGTPIAVLDEAALQEIVRQILREELQGVLGERITRNVRKLVRAEINRALVARDLD